MNHTLAGVDGIPLWQTGIRGMLSQDGRPPPTVSGRTRATVGIRTQRQGGRVRVQCIGGKFDHMRIADGVHTFTGIAPDPRRFQVLSKCVIVQKNPPFPCTGLLATRESIHTKRDVLPKARTRRKERLRSPLSYR